MSLPIFDSLGVIQGGITSGLLFRKYMSDLSDYLRNEFAICINDIILAHMLWSDDLILISDSNYGLQKQLDGLQQFCSRNMIIVNVLKKQSNGVW